MIFDESFIKLEPSTPETVTDLQNYLDSFDKEIEGNKIIHVQTSKYYFYLKVYFIFK